MGKSEVAVKIEYAAPFLRSAKVLTKKYPSFLKDLEEFTKELKKKPKSGSDLGGGIRKIRMAIESKGKGKRGGARIITFNALFDKKNMKITLLYVYDKKVLDTISKSQIKQLLIESNILKK